jgi:hypothetical protein
VSLSGAVVRILSYNHDFHLIKWTEIQSMEYFITWWVNSGSASLLLLEESCELLKGPGKVSFQLASVRPETSSDTHCSVVAVEAEFTVVLVTVEGPASLGCSSALIDAIVVAARWDRGINSWSSVYQMVRP